MTAEEFWKSWLLFWLLVGPFLLGIVGMAYSLYLSRRHLGAIKEALKNSRYIYLWGPSLGKRGLIWSLLEIAKITQIIIYPRSSLHIGELDPDDLEQFPPRLRRLLKIKSIMLIVNGVWVVAVFVLLKFE